MRQKRRFAAAIIAAALSAAWLTGCTGSRQADGTAIQATEDGRLEETAGLQNADGSPEEQKMQDSSRQKANGAEKKTGKNRRREGNSLKQNNTDIE